MGADVVNSIAHLPFSNVQLTVNPWRKICI